MEQTKLALSVVMIVVVGLIGTNFITYSAMTEQEKFGALSSSNNIKGHMTIVHSDPDGNVLSYIQTDNVVGLIGKACLAERVFGDHASTCETGKPHTNFTTIALYDGESFRDNINATTGGANNDLLDTNTLVTALGLTIRNGGEGVVVSKSADPVSGGIGAKTDIAKTFTAGAGVSVQNVDGAALFNNGTGAGGGELPTAVLAAQVFDKVTLNESDTLLITWTIELGG